jgi:hypothetical protein
MASIRGISIDMYLETLTEDGGYFYGQILMDGKKIGEFENEDGEGKTAFRFDRPEDQAEFERRVDKYFAEHPATLNDPEGFILELLELMEAEQEFIKRSKQHQQPFILVQANTYSRTSIFDDITEVAASYYTILDESELQPLIQKIRPAEYYLYRNLQDFVK